MNDHPAVPPTNRESYAHSLVVLHEATAELRAFSAELETLTAWMHNQFAESALGQRQKRSEANPSQPEPTSGP